MFEIILMILLFIAIITIVIVFVVKGTRKTNSTPSPPASPPQASQALRAVVNPTVASSSCRTGAKINYPINDFSQPDLEGSPQPGVQKFLADNRCSYYSILNSNRSALEKQKIIEDHLIVPTTEKCDQDCDNLFLQQLYESYLVKSCLEDASITASIITVYNKVFNALRLKLNAQQDGLYETTIQNWINLNVEGEVGQILFPSSQQNRDWSSYSRKYILRNLSGIEHDPTEILIGGDFMKALSFQLPANLRQIRDYSFNNILKRVRGYRTNQGKRTKTEAQFGITRFDFDELISDGKYYTPAPWMHPGRSECVTSPLQGSNSNQAIIQGVPLECGVSGSTNFWLWTILYSEANLTMEETRLLLLSAYIVLSADGGHSLNEVLSSACINSMFWKYYLVYSQDRTFAKLFSSPFATNLYEITKNFNPIGPGPFIQINDKDVASQIYSTAAIANPNDVKNTYFYYFNDRAVIPADEILKRQQIESFFIENRCPITFGKYTAFLDQLPQLNKIRSSTISLLEKYVTKYCVNSGTWGI